MPEAKNEEILFCSFCRGHGAKGNGELCPACKGVGKFLAPDKWVYCSACSGNGRQHSKKDKPCPACGGKGKAVPKLL